LRLGKGKVKRNSGKWGDGRGKRGEELGNSKNGGKWSNRGRI
jgi:hypothetical protein